MFSGIIEEIGKVTGLSSSGGFSVCEILCPGISPTIKPGDSVAVNGVCLTAEKAGNGRFTASLSTQTKKETGLGLLKTGDWVNLETSLKMGDPVGGHLITGHIDFKTTLKHLSRSSQASISFEVKQGYEKYVVKRGPIAVDGMSLTIAEISGREIKIFLVPFTIENTNLLHRHTGDIINIEVDLNAKYLEKAASDAGKNIPSIIKNTLI